MEIKASWVTYLRVIVESFLSFYLAIFCIALWFLEHRHKQAKKQGKNDFILYDHDLPNYKFVIEINSENVYVKETIAPKSVDPKKIEKHRAQLLVALTEVLPFPPANIFFDFTETVVKPGSKSRS